MCAQIATNYDTYAAELKLAGPHWERKPVGAAEGEAAWCARQVAEHIAMAASYFANGIATAAGIEGPGMRQYQFATAEDAAKATAEGQAGFMGVANRLSDAQLATEIDHPRLGKQTLGGILTIVAYHYQDHANQLRTLRVG
jgi:hypothetical protein